MSRRPISRGGGARDGLLPRAVYAGVWSLMALPLVLDLWRASRGTFLGHEAANVDMGRWAWRFLLATLAIRPAVQLLRRPILFRYRRTVGLFAFAYTLAHSLDYLLYARAWTIPFSIWLQRLYLWVGIAATLMLLPLAITSLDVVRRRVGAFAWRRLHRSLYAVGLLVMVHALWEDSADYAQSIVCSIILVVLLAARLPVGQRLIARIQPARSRVARLPDVG